VAGPRVVTPDIPVFDYEWGHRVALSDYHLSKTGVQAGDTLELTLRWRVLQPVVTPLAATVQIMDVKGVKIGQSDAGLNLNQPAGSILTDQRTLSIAPGALPGVYDIKLGVYNSLNVQNLLLYQNQHLALGGALLPLWQVRVQPAVR
jgi:hypothetical protein